MSLYNPPLFRQSDPDALLAALSAQPFATLVSNGPQAPLVSHLPLMAERGADGAVRLIGHLARANRHWLEMDRERPSTAIFHGPDAYVSPGWYPSKREHGRVVPTWNYSVVHAVGMVQIHDDADWLRAAVSRLTARHEAGRAAPWALSDAPEPFIAAQLKGIVGVELVVSTLEGKEKLSQNRSPADRSGVIDGLAGADGAGSAAVRAAMLRREPG